MPDRTMIAAGSGSEPSRRLVRPLIGRNVVPRLSAASSAVSAARRVLQPRRACLVACIRIASVAGIARNAAQRPTSSIRSRSRLDWVLMHSSSDWSDVYCRVRAWPGRARLGWTPTGRRRPTGQSPHADHRGAIRGGLPAALVGADLDLTRAAGGVQVGVALDLELLPLRRAVLEDDLNRGPAGVS